MSSSVNNKIESNIEALRARVKAHLAYTYPNGVPDSAHFKLEGSLGENEFGEFYDGYYGDNGGSLGRPIYSKIKSDGSFFTGGPSISWQEGDWLLIFDKYLYNSDDLPDKPFGSCRLFGYESYSIPKFMAREPPTNGWTECKEVYGREQLKLTYFHLNWLNLEPVKESTKGSGEFAGIDFVNLPPRVSKGVEEEGIRIDGIL